MSDRLSDALREGGHADLADQLERKQLAGQLRETGRNDLAERLETPEAPPAEPEPVKSPEVQMAERMRDAMNESLTKWVSL
jgi:hypothetical protein